MNDIDPSQIVPPPNWSILTGDAGRYFILLAALAFTISGLAWIFAPKLKALPKLGSWALHIGSVALLGSFACLATLFVNNRFEYAYVYGHSDTQNALSYRIAGIWSGQEGSFLLWACCAAIFAILTAGRTGKFRRWYSVAYSVFLGAISSILAFESPYKLNLIDGTHTPFVPMEGAGLAPSLQNYWVVIHPPTIFLGFGSLTVLFALAFAALAEKDLDSWIPVVRPWSIVSLSLTGLGLCMGGFWAYETLGWGGFWMWDPVENVSFVPWCFAIAFSHGVLVQVTRNKWKIANTLLAAFPFIVFVYGTFLTRSGFLSDASVHSFAEMDNHALKLLVGVMGLTTLGFTGLMVYRAIQFRKETAAATDEKGLTKEGFLFYGIWGLVVMGIATAVGMSVPLLQALRGQKAATVPEALYHQVLPWIFIPIMVLMALTPFISWRKMGAKEFWSKVYTITCVSVGIVGIVLVAIIKFAKDQITLTPEMTLIGKKVANGLPWMLFLITICVFALVANSWQIAQLWKRGKLGVSGFLAHVGVCILMTGLVVSRGFEIKEDTVVTENQPGRAMNYEIKYVGMTGPATNRNNKLLLDIYKVDPNSQLDAQGRPSVSKKLFRAEPGLYNLTMADGRENTMVWPYIRRGALSDVYISLQPPQKQTGEDFTIKEGETKDINGIKMTYKKMTMDGEPGQAGTKFGALVEASAGKETKTVNPKMELRPGGPPADVPAVLDTDLELAMVAMNASDHTVTLHLQTMSMVYPVQVFHKPLTSFVWLGTGVMTLGGLLAAFYRAPKRVPSSNKLGQHTVPVPKTAS